MDNNLASHIKLLTWAVVTYVLVITSIVCTLFYKLNKCIDCLSNVCNNCDIKNKLISIIDNVDKKSKTNINYEALDSKYDPLEAI